MSTATVSITLSFFNCILLFMVLHSCPHVPPSACLYPTAPRQSLHVVCDLGSAYIFLNKIRINKKINTFLIIILQSCSGIWPDFRHEHISTLLISHHTNEHLLCIALHSFVLLEIFKTSLKVIYLRQMAFSALSF